MKNNADRILSLARWLEQQPSLEELQKRFPDSWILVEKEIVNSVGDSDHSRLDHLLRPLSYLTETNKPKKSLNKKETRDMMNRMVCQRMAAIAIERFLKNSLNENKYRHLKPLEKFLLRCLFFNKDYTRKLVSNWMFRLLWPLMNRPNLLLPLAEAHGIYCFYSKAFIAGLTGLLEGRKCIEIGAGDGALARFLTENGLEISAFDDQSWGGKIRYGNNVVKLDAQSALREFRPEMVICSWPPALNNFEEQVFTTSSVKRYVVIGSENRNSFGNWPVYLTQNTFTLRKDDDLASYLLPSEFGGAIYIFDRK